jgi:four helix bundle protein
MGAKRVQELDVWRLCEDVRLLVVAGIARAPACRDLRFCNQILTAAEDAVSNISEGFGRFRPREFAQFLGYAIASTAEVLARTRFAHERKYFDDETAARLVLLCTRADRALRTLRAYLWTVSSDKVPVHPAAAARRSRPRPTRPPKNDREEPS